MKNSQQNTTQKNFREKSMKLKFTNHAPVDVRHLVPPYRPLQLYSRYDVVVQFRRHYIDPSQSYQPTSVTTRCAQKFDHKQPVEDKRTRLFDATRPASSGTISPFASIRTICCLF
jgi:hypothetical protein